MPIRLAISLSAATARIDLPVLVRETKRESPTTDTATVTITTTEIRSSVIPRIVQVPSSTAGTPKPVLRPEEATAVFCRNNDAPIAVMRGTSRGAFRKRAIRDALQEQRDRHRA